jgi:hypothetical protein
MASGILLLTLSIIDNSQVIAFIGLSLAFWGGLFFFIKPETYVEASLLDSTAVPAYTTIDRAMEEFKQKSKSYYIPPYPEKARLPEHLKKLKDAVVFIPAESNSVLPSIEEMTTGKFLLKDPKGICITPPGLDLLSRIEKEIRTDPEKLGLDELCEVLPTVILENFGLAKEIEMKHEGDQVTLRITGSVYKNLYTNEKLRSIHTIGCPLTSAIACAISKTTGKIVTIERDLISRDTETAFITYCLLEG